MTLSGIYAYISRNYQYYKANEKGWQVSTAVTNLLALRMKIVICHIHIFFVFLYLGLESSIGFLL